MTVDSAELVVIGAGAAGLATAIFTARAAPGRGIVCIDSARHIGAKILISGGSRCNVTNRVVTEKDFWGGPQRFVRNVLRAFPERQAIEFFSALGVELHEEEDGKLFPDSNTSRTVLNALLGEAGRLGISLVTGERVIALTKDDDEFVATTASGRTIRARAAVICTGGRSLPKTGSDGFGYELARRLGHGCVSTIPALAPLLFDGWQDLAGITHPAAMTLRVDGTPVTTLEGSLLWTHFGASGPAPLDVSRHWHRAAIEGRAVAVDLSFRPGERFESVDAHLIADAAARPRASIATVLAVHLPASVAAQILAALELDPTVTMAHLAREDRRRLAHALTAWPMPIAGSRGFNYAEATAGGVTLDEIEPATMESRVCPGLYLAGEVLDVDGRLGGFNFQWAWASGYVAGRGVTT